MNSATIAVQLRCKRINSPEEKWEVMVNLVKEQGEWKIFDAPGKKVDSFN
jgi:hypothetical protein